MKTVVLLFHPHLDQSRVNKTLAAAAENAANVTVRNMYDLYPNFQIDIATEQEVLKKAGRVVFQFPTYWYSTPALMKQWEDDVLVHGWAYGSQGKALVGKEFVVATSTGADAENYTRGGDDHYWLAEFYRNLQDTAKLINMKYVRPFFTFDAEHITDDALDRQAKRYASYISQDAPLKVLGPLQTEADYALPEL